MVGTLADQHQAVRAGLTATTAEYLRRLWSRTDPQNIARSWNSRVHDAAGFVSEMQLASAVDAEQYMTANLLARERLPDGPRLNPSGFAGYSYPAGRQSTAIPLEYALMGPAFTALQSIGKGASTERGMAMGLNSLVTHGATAVEDAGRAADSVVVNTEKQITGYVRQVEAGACSDCAILAGRRYARNEGFDRHPNCLCTHVPLIEGESAPELQDPYDVFNSMSQDEQDARWGPESAQAIRDGGDIFQVTNAKRGRSVDKMTTAEGTALRRGRPRGFAGQQMQREGLLTRDGGNVRWKTGRMTPEAIYKHADNQDQVQQLLRKNGYITGPQDGRGNLSPVQSGWAGPAQGYWRSAGPGATLQDAMREERLGNYTWNPNT